METSHFNLIVTIGLTGEQEEEEEEDVMNDVKTAKIIVFDSMKCKSPNVYLQDELLT